MIFRAYSFLLAVLGFFLVVSLARINEDAILKKCECHGTVPSCDFTNLSKSKLLTLAEKLLTFKIGCAANDGFHIPIFTAKRMLQRASTRREDVTSTSAVSSTGTVQQQPLEQRMSTALEPIHRGVCRFEYGLSCDVVNYGIKFIFPTVLMVHNIMEEYSQVARRHTDDLAQLILDLEAEGDGCPFNLHGGYRTVDGFMSSPHPSIQWLRAIIVPRVQTMLGLVNNTHVNFDITGWGAVLRTGHGQNVHVHPGSMYAGVYYVTVPPEVGQNPTEAGGCIQFLDPRGGAPMMQLVRGKNFYGSGAVQVCPPHGGGLLLMFPSWLQHEVKPLPVGFTGPRIAISFNIVFKGMN